MTTRNGPQYRPNLPSDTLTLLNQAPCSRENGPSAQSSCERHIDIPCLFHVLAAHARFVHEFVRRVAAGSAVKLLPGQFGEGGLRTVQRLRMDSGEGQWEELVAKTFKFELTDRVASTKEWYYRCVEHPRRLSCLALLNVPRLPRSESFITRNACAGKSKAR